MTAKVDPMELWDSLNTYAPGAYAPAWETDEVKQLRDRYEARFRELQPMRLKYLRLKQEHDHLMRVEQAKLEEALDRQRRTLGPWVVPAQRWLWPARYVRLQVGSNLHDPGRAHLHEDAGRWRVAIVSPKTFGSDVIGLDILYSDSAASIIAAQEAADIYVREAGYILQ